MTDYGSGAVEQSTIDARYGRTRGAARRTRWFAIGVAATVGVVLTGWLVWGGLGGAAAQLQARDLGHRIIDDATVSVSWSLTIGPGSEARCAVQAMNSTFGTVGWKVVDIPASELVTREFTETVLTTERAVTGLIYRCWPA